MTGIQTLFPRSSFVGFDHLFNEMEHTVRHAADHYPPHNIIRASEHEYLIELAVAGFSKDDYGSSYDTVFNKGGIASKPKKKKMKRGGLASKK